MLQILCSNHNIYPFYFSAAIYANRHYLRIYEGTHPERLAQNGDDKPKVIGDVFIHPTATVDPSAKVWMKIDLHELTRECLLKV